MNSFFKKSALSEAQMQEIQKAVYLGTDDASYVAQLGVQVDPSITNMHPAQDQFRRRLERYSVTNNQLSAVFTVLNEISFVTATDPFFAAGGCPPSIEYNITQDSVVKKHYGVESGLTLAAIAALRGSANAQGLSGRVMDAMEQEMSIQDIAFRNAEDHAMINGDSGANALAFDGIDALVTDANGSLVVDLGGDDITKADLTEIISLQMMRGVMVTSIMSNPMMIAYIQELWYELGGAVGPQDEWNFQTVPTPAGNVSLVGDAHIAVNYAGTGNGGNNYSTTVFILTETHNGEPILYMDYLIPETILPNDVFSNGTNCTSKTMGIFAVGALVNRAPVAQAKIVNAGFNASGDLSTAIEELSSKII